MINRIEIEGVDKTGKDTLLKYIDIMSNHRYVIHSRGLLSFVVYADVYGRDYNYEKEITCNQDTLIILLEADLEDLQIRHKMTGEPKIDIERDIEAFKRHAKYFEELGIKVLRYDTTMDSPFKIAKDVLRYLEVNVK